MLLSAPNCLICKHFYRTSDHKSGCKAFLDKTPLEMIEPELDHLNPYPGDNGIQFEPISQEAFDEWIEITSELNWISALSDNEFLGPVTEGKQ